MPTTTTRFLWLFLLVLLKNEQVNSQQGFTLVKHANMMQSSGRIEQSTVISISECLQHCLRDCRCSAFDIHEDDMTCYHLRPYPNDAPRLMPQEGYSHFDIKQDRPNEQHCDAMKQCKLSINCCLTSNPCSDHGTCTPTHDIRARFNCACSLGFSGKYCNKCTLGYAGENCKNRIASCRGHANGLRSPNIYHIRDSKNIPLKVFCDFEKDSNISWTLIQSYSFEHRTTFHKPFFTDFTKNTGNVTENWSSYRLSKARMESIQSDSTKWRVTCEFDKTLTAIKRDFMQGSKADLDIMTFNKFGVCKKVDYINVRGYNCSNCTAVLYQTLSYPFHLDARQSQSKCNFTVVDPIGCGGRGGEDSFGLYNCAHQKHRCSAILNSTTQTWLGG